MLKTMSAATSQTKKAHFQRIAVFFAGLGYCANILQWMWVAILLLPTFLMSEQVQFFMPQPVERQHTPSPAMSEPSVLTFIILGLIAATIIVATLFVLIRIPAAITRAGEKATKKTAATIVPLFAHHAPLPEKKRRQLTASIAKALQLSLVIIPFLLLGLTLISTPPLDREIVFFVGAFLAPWPLLWFSLQHYFEAKTDKKYRS